MMLAVLLSLACALQSPHRGMVLSQGKAAMSAPAFDKVLTMLQNLVSQIEAEQQADEADFSNFMAWFGRQHSSTSSAITALGNKITTVAATLGELTSQQGALHTQVQEQTAELDQEQSQLDDAKDKRAHEHDSFVKEQLDFDNAIAGCNKAVEILQAHYGDGSPKEDTRPSWMALMGVFHSIKKAAHRSGRALPASLVTLTAKAAQPATGSGMFDSYEGRGDEAGNIVDQVKLLSSTFQEDKDSSVEQESGLQGAFETLMGQKSALITTLTTERDSQQAVLNGLNQQVSEQQNAQATAQSTMQGEQAYLSQIEGSEKDTQETYTRRKADQEAEKKAVGAAVGVLQSENPALLQIKKAHKRRAAALLQVSDPECKRCMQAAALLKKKAGLFHSQLLATAAATTGTGDVLTTVVGQLAELVTRLDQEQASEQSHKNWCEKELSDSHAKKVRHETLVAELEKTITEVEGTIADKEASAEENADTVEEADRKFTELKQLREKASADYDAELVDYNDAIGALNTAIDMLADFYRDGAFVQTKPAQKLTLALRQDPLAAEREAAPTTSGAAEQKGGLFVVTALKDTRQEFESGKGELISTEQKAVSDMAAATSAHEANRGSLVESGNRITVELQTAQNEYSMAKENLQNNKNEVSATTDYLANVGKSCQSLLDHFADRSELRAQEKMAIADAIQVLQSA